MEKRKRILTKVMNKSQLEALETKINDIYSEMRRVNEWYFNEIHQLAQFMGKYPGLDKLDSVWNSKHNI